MSSTFSRLGWDKPASQYLRYFSEQKRGERDVPVAFVEGEFAGCVTVMRNPEYPPFRSEGVPEIRDLNVLPRFRREGIATRLMDEAERLAVGRSSVVGIGVGMTVDYGAAQRMYAERRYVPDGQGLIWNGEPVTHGEHVPVDDDLVLFFTKKLGS